MRQYSILLVEDDEVDAMTIDRAFSKAHISNPLVRTKNGIEALEVLRNGKIQRPMIVLLDLNMPMMGGLEFLEVIKDDPTICDIPVIVLTSSKNDEDITQAYEGQVAGYMTKPVGMDDFIEKMAALGRYWSLCEM